MEYLFALAEKGDLEAVFGLIDGRIRWMDEKGIRQWNVRDYWNVYPKEYYARKQRQRELFVLKRQADQRVVGAAAILEEDEYWQEDSDVPAYYIHNLVADSAERGAGRALLRCIEKRALEKGKICLRLDCAMDNQRLNDYYEQMGFVLAGVCYDGNYTGNKREKKLLLEGR